MPAIPGQTTKKRIIFSFDDHSYHRLEQIKDTAKFSTLAETVKESLRVARALQQQKGEGFSEVLVRNPKTKEERVMIIPAL